jgi:plasmid stabilization system protein ParE
MVRSGAKPWDRAIPSGSGFRNWLIFYVETDMEILLVRVLHGARDIPALFHP